MKTPAMLAIAVPIAAALAARVAAQCPTQPSAIVTAYPIHSMDRPQPPVVTPAPAGAPVPAPSDAIVLFDGRDLSQWRNGDSNGRRSRSGDQGGERL